MIHSKILRVKVVTKSGQIPIGNWLGFEAVNSGSIGVTVGRNRLDQKNDFTCKDSDGIPFASDQTLEILFDETPGKAELTIEYTELICC